MKREHGFDFSDTKITPPSETQKPKAKAKTEKTGPSLESRAALENVRKMGIEAVQAKIAKMGSSKESTPSSDDVDSKFDYSDEEKSEEIPELSSDLLTEEEDGEEVEDLTHLAKRVG